MKCSKTTEYLNSRNTLLKLYISNGYEKIINNKYNLLLILFGKYILFYNNMLSQALFLLLLEFIIMLFIPLYWYSLCYFIINIVIFLFYNKIYLRDAKYKIYKICSKNDSYNLIKNKIVISKKIACILLPLYVMLSFTVLFISNTLYEFNTYNGNNGQYNDLYFAYPRDYKISGNVVSSKDNICKVNFNYSDLLSKESIILYYNITTPLNTLEVNNIIFDVYKLNNNSSLYLYSYNNNLYYLKIDGFDLNQCKKPLNMIIDSLEIKEVN